MKKFLLVSALTLVAACQGATTKTPGISKAELEEERRAQQALLNSGTIAQTGANVPITQEMAARFTQIAQRVGVAGDDMCKELKNAKCSFEFKLEEDKVLNAYADGKTIVISSAMVQFADNDELANVISHEYAHNLMSHVASQQKNAMAGTLLGSAVDIAAGSYGYNTNGMFGKVGQQQGVLRYSVAFEQEADYVGLYIMKRSGYDITKSPNFWRKMSAADSSGIYSRTTHPSNPERYIALNKTIEEINRKQAAGQPVVPDFKKK